MSVDDIYQVTFAGGLQDDVIQVIFICCPAFRVIDVGESVTVATGAAKYN